MTTFRELHGGLLPLFLPDAWDVPSALAFVAEGYPAIGTTSLGVASSLGRPDGGRATRQANLRLADQLRPLPVPISVDIEDGYSDDPGEVATYVSLLGVAGVNLEDSSAERLVDPSAFAAKIAAVKQRNPDVFVNARIDTYWLHQDETLEATLTRGTLYAEAGADGVFIPGVSDREALRTITGTLRVPVNVLATLGHTLAELGHLGVRRVSTGSMPYRASIEAATRAVAAAREGLEPPLAASYDVVQARLTAYAAATQALTDAASPDVTLSTMTSAEPASN
jgi:2-methylisocitrate lyase-like PEP mutase family enzyme